MAAASTSPSIFSATRSSSNSNASPSVSNIYATSFMGAHLRRYYPATRKLVRISRGIIAAAVATAPAEEIKELLIQLTMDCYVHLSFSISKLNFRMHGKYTLPTWANFDLGRSPVYWKTMNGLPPTSGERLKLFYNPAANNMVPNEDFGIAFNGGFNQPIMCGGEPRIMLQKFRGKADPPIYTIQICIPKHALSLIFSFTNGTEWDGPYRLQFQVPKAWRNKPTEFFTEGLAQELSQEGACDRAIFPDSNILITRCAMVGNLNVDGGDRCNLDLVPGCIDPSSPYYNPLANVDDGSCPPYSDSED